MAVDNMSFNPAHESYAGRIKQEFHKPTDMVCPELEEFGDARFWSRSCLAKTCVSNEWYKVTGLVDDTDEDELACRYKGCKEGNRQRAKYGLPPLCKPSKESRKGEQRMGNCDVCGVLFYKKKHPTTCGVCRAKVELETCTDKIRANYLKRLIHNGEKYRREKLGKKSKSSAARERERRRMEVFKRGQKQIC